MNGREEYFNKIRIEINKVSKDKDRIMAYAKRLMKTNAVPMDISLDYLTRKKDIMTALPPLAFCIGTVLNVDPEMAYSSAQIEKYLEWEYSSPKLPKNLEYEMIQITDDQWIGKITAAQLMQLRDAQIINYNENTQRVMRRVTNGKIEFYEIALNQKAIMQLEKLYLSGTYIPNTITLNMPEGTFYTYTNGLLTIQQMDHFDITDGYHRYIAMSNLYNDDNTFDYPMVLCITNYSQDKARQLIWQEDQKTKMARIDSESMNMNSLANKIVTRLNMSSTFNLAGMISSNGGLINAAEFAEIIRIVFFPVSRLSSKQMELTALIETEKKLNEKINFVTAMDTSLLGEKWSRNFLYCLIYAIGSRIPDEQLLDVTRKLEKLTEEEKMFRFREISRIDVRRLNDMYRKVVEKDV